MGSSFVPRHSCCQYVYWCFPDWRWSSAISRPFRLQKQWATECTRGREEWEAGKSKTSWVSTPNWALSSTHSSSPRVSPNPLPPGIALNTTLSAGSSESSFRWKLCLSSGKRLKSKSGGGLEGGGKTGEIGYMSLGIDNRPVVLVIHPALHIIERVCRPG